LSTLEEYIPGQHLLCWPMNNLLLHHSRFPKASLKNSSNCPSAV
jgi:hypothetical protein